MHTVYKYICVIIVLTGFYIPCSGQIGINTENPLALIHLDASGNNPDSGTPDLSQQRDDVAVKLINQGATLSIGGILDDNSSAQLYLGDTHKAFMTNRVTLQSIIDLITIPDPIEGMVVYNTIANGSGDTKVVPGLYYFDGTTWKLFMTSIYGQTLNIRELQQDAASTSGTSTDYSNSVELNFGDISITQDGSYAFSFRLYGPTTNSSTGGIRGIFYVWLIVNDIAIDVAEINPTIFPMYHPISYSIILGGKLSAGDQVKIKFSHYRNPGSAGDVALRNWTLKAAASANDPLTTLMYWRL